MKPLQDIRILDKASINLDKDDRLLGANEFREIRNAYEKDGVLINLPGTNKISTGLPKYNNLTLYGWCRDVENKAIILLLKHSTSSVIHRYYTVTGTTEIIYSSTILNFQNWTQCVVIDGLLYWTDNYEKTPLKFTTLNNNPPRYIDMERAKNYLTREYFGQTVNPWAYNTSYPIGTYVTHNENVFKAKQIVPVNIAPVGGSAYWKWIEIYDIDTNYLNIDSNTLDRIKHPPSYPPILSNKSVRKENYTLITFINGVGDDAEINQNNIIGKLWQFRYRYVYYNNEKSVWSAISKLPLPAHLELAEGFMPVNQNTQNVLGLDISTGTSEVVRIEIAARESNVGFWKLIEVIEKYDKNGRFIDYKSQFLSTPEITYFFYNDVEGDVLDQDDVGRLYHDVPQISKNLELIENNRLVDGNYIKGYNNINLDISFDWSYDPIPYDYTLEESMTIINPSPHFPVNGYDNYYYGIMITSATVGKYYYLSTYWYTDPNVAWGSTGNATILLHAAYVAKEGDTENDIAKALYDEIVLKAINSIIGYSIQGTVSSNIIVIKRTWNNYFGGGTTLYLKNIDSKAISNLQSYPSFKQGNTYNVGVVYYDRAGRSSNVQANSQCQVYSPYPTERPSSYRPIEQVSLDWTIKNKPPEFAAYFQFVLTKGAIEKWEQMLLQGSQVHYEDNELEIWVDFNVAIAATKETFNQFNMDYWTFEKGDRIRFMAIQTPLSAYLHDYYDFEIDRVEYPIKVYEQDETGAYILDNLGNKVRDFGTGSFVIKSPIGFNKSSVFNETSNYVWVEIYRPNRHGTNDENKLYFEIGDRMPIVNPHTESRYHYGDVQTQTDTLAAKGSLTDGDSYAIHRLASNGLFECESMRYSDNYDSDSYSFGRINIINRDAKRQRYKANLCWSGLYIENTQVNNLNDVAFKDFMAIPEKYGEINHINEVGFTLKVRQDVKSHSIYIGRQVLEQAGVEQAIISSSKNVLGTLMTSDDRWGCLDTQSTIQSLRYEYFVDVINGAIIRDASNGPVAISEYGLSDWVKDRCDILLNECNSYKVLAGIDQYNSHIYFTFWGYNKDTGTYYNDTVVFNEKENTWKFMMELPSDELKMDTYIYFGNIMYSFYQGDLYKHRDRDDSVIYENAVYPELNVVINNDPTKIKIFKSIVLNTNQQWNAPTNGDVNIPATLNNSQIQGSFLPTERFKAREGMLYAPFGKNMVAANGAYQIQRYVNGEQLRGEVMRIKLTCLVNEGVELRNIVTRSIHSKKSGINDR